MLFRTLFTLLSFWIVSFIAAAPVPSRFLKNNDHGAGQIPLALPPSLTDAPPSPSTSPRPTTFLLPNWVTAPYANSLGDDDRHVFEDTIQGITLSSKHASMGNNNAGVYSVASFNSSFVQRFPRSVADQNISADRLLVKVLKDVDDYMVAEVKALKIVDQFVASGLLRIPVGKANKVNTDTDDLFELKPVIVMLKMTGKPLTSIPEYISEENPEKRRQMMGDTLNMMCNRVGELALQHGFVHRDNIIGNVLVIFEGNEVVDVNIIDWGGKYLSSIRDDVTWDDLMAWCHRRWAVWVWDEGVM